ncbi:MAG: deoxyribodipyrimidine photo-lyase [Pseudomonadota bacterium]
MGQKPIIWWVRKDLRLADNPVLSEMAASGRSVIPVFILDEVFSAYGAAPRWRFGLGAEDFSKNLARLGSRLIFRRGDALCVLQALVEETGADTVRWGRAYDPDQVARDKAVKAGLKDAGVDAASVAGSLLFEPWTAQTKTGGFYRVYTPFWKSVRDNLVPEPDPAPSVLAAPDTWPDTDDPARWDLAADMARGADIVRPHCHVGEDAAKARLDSFIATKIADYATARDHVAEDGTSGLSENLAWGEIGPRTCWHAGWAAMEAGAPGAEVFLKELVWREFAYHLVWHTPHITSSNWKPDWDAFTWNTDATAEVTAWRQGRTGMEFVDAAMREMYVTGRMHNRARMIVASYLTKHLMSHWKIGLDWFAQCLVDWDPASNAMGWQWSAGSGPDATPYFRVFNPETQAEKFDPGAVYRRRWIAEGQGNPPQTALDYFAAVPRSWGLDPKTAYPRPVVGAAEGRARALDAYSNRSF